MRYVSASLKRTRLRIKFAVGVVCVRKLCLYLLFHFEDDGVAGLQVSRYGQQVPDIFLDKKNGEAHGRQKKKDQ